MTYRPRTTLPILILVSQLTACALYESAPDYQAPDEGNNTTTLDMGGDTSSTLNNATIPDMDGDTITSPDMNTTNNTSNNTSTTSTTTTPTAPPCMPIEVCPDSACGTISDGCGGEVVCAQQCACAGGQPTEAQCGPCGLGTTVCEADSSDGSCQISQPLLGIGAGQCAQMLLFVDASAPAGGDGSAASPYRTYAEAAASAQPGQSIVLAARQYDEPIDIKEGVHVTGGYEHTGGQWTRTAQTSSFQVAAPSNGDVFGLTARNIITRTYIDRIKVTTADAPLEGNNYGAYILSSPGLSMDAIEIHAGKGGDGRDGADGVRGADGVDGEDALSPECNPSSAVYAFDHASGAKNLSCPSAHGGDGGNMGLKNEFNVITAPTNGKNAVGGAQGGQIAQSTNSSSGDGKTVGPPSSSASGMGGESSGSVLSNFWVSSGDGEAGMGKRHGSGGGGGAGSWWSDAHYFDGLNAHFGNMGGSGASGGCGGDGGQGGGGGSGSFGIFLVNTGNGFIAKNSQVSAQRGGAGGDGGDGGLGGRGGSGGAGSDIYLDHKSGQTCSLESLTKFSGDGGNGADGASGGEGGGGAGGVSYGMYCHQSQPTLNNVSSSAGQSALGGRGGAPASSSGDTADQVGCQ